MDARVVVNALNRSSASIFRWKEMCTQTLTNFLINLKRINNRFSNNFFALPELFKNRFFVDLRPQHCGVKIWVSADIYGIHDVVHEEGESYKSQYR